MREQTRTYFFEYNSKHATVDLHCNVNRVWVFEKATFNFSNPYDLEEFEFFGELNKAIVEKLKELNNG